MRSSHHVRVAFVPKIPSSRPMIDHSSRASENEVRVALECDPTEPVIEIPILFFLSFLLFLYSERWYVGPPLNASKFDK